MAYSDQPSPKRQKPRRKADQNGIDRLSNLPENILLHILSLLPTETAAATSVLSKTWQFLWTSVPNLDFDDSRSHRTTVDHIFQLYRDRSFENFVTGVLLRRRERFIRRFRLKCHKSYDHSDLDLWVSSVTAQNVQELDLDLGKAYITHRFKFRFPQQSCKTLVVLKLKSVLIEARRLDKVYFPLLKIFHLERAKCKCLEIKFLQSGFPVLEELLISGLTDTNFEISLPILRSLVITLPWKCGLIRIDCPALTHLVEANIDMDCFPRIGVSAEKDESYGTSVMNVVKAISNVRILRLSKYTTKVIELVTLYRGVGIPVFHNLVQVELDLPGRAWETMMLMLRSFENLERLTLRYKGVCDRKDSGRRVDRKKFIRQTHVPDCLTSRLTMFCSREFKGRDDEMKLTRYILENSLVLKNMIILFSSSVSLKDGHRIRRGLRKYPRGSEGCLLEFDHLQSPDSDSDSVYSDNVSDSDSDSDSSDNDYVRV